MVQFLGWKSYSNSETSTSSHNSVVMGHHLRDSGIPNRKSCLGLLTSQGSLKWKNSRKEPPLQTHWSTYTKVESLGPLHWGILPSEGPPNYMLYMVHTWKAKCSDIAGNFSHHLIRNAWNTPAEKYFLISCAIWRHYPRVIFVLFYSEVGLLEHSSWTCSDLN